MLDLLSMFVRRLSHNKYAQVAYFEFVSAVDAELGVDDNDGIPNLDQTMFPGLQ